jgi:hypothetical protein
MPTYTEQLRRKQEADAVAKLAQANADAWRQILREHLSVIDGEANFRLTLEFCEGSITSEKFRVLIQEQPTGFELAFGDDTPKLIEKIMLVIDPKGIRFSESLNSKMTRKAAVGPVDFGNEERRRTYINEEKRLGYLNRIQLIDELERRNLNAELRSMSVEEVTQRRDSFRPERPSRREDGYPALPRYLVLPGHIQATEATPELLRNLVKTDYRFWRELVRKYGSAQITERSQ